MKKAIIVVSFGTSYLEAIEKSIGKIENRIRERFEEYEVYRAFTAHRIIKKLREKHSIVVPTPEEILDNLHKEGYEEIIIQPLHIIPGEEFQYINRVRDEYKNKFNTLYVGRPVFYYEGIEDIPNDYSLFIESIKDLINDKNVVMVGHGTAHPSNAVYGCLQCVLEDKGYNNVFIGTVEGYPTFESVLNRLNKRSIKEVTIVPLMLVAGDHAVNDMAGEDEDSWKSMLEANGIKVNMYLYGLGEHEGFEDLYVQRIDDIINKRYLGIGETKKGKRRCKH